MALSSGLSKKQDFLGRLQDEAPFKLARAAGYPFNPRTDFTGLMPE